MKILRLLALIAALFTLTFTLTSCTTARGTIDAATTKIEIRQGKNKGFAVAFPKELQATKLDLRIDPQSGEIKLTADQLKSSSTGIIESAGVAQAQAMAALSQTLNTALSALLPMLARAASLPALPVANSEQRIEPMPEAETVQPFSPSPLQPLALAPLAPFVIPAPGAK